MTSEESQEYFPISPDTDSTDPCAKANFLTENQKKKRRQKLAKKKRISQLTERQQRDLLSERRREDEVDFRGPSRGSLGSRGLEESFMTAESDKSSISNMQVWAAPQSQPLQRFSALHGQQGGRPSKRQRIDTNPSILQINGQSARDLQQHSLPQRSPRQPAVYVPAASSASQHSIRQDEAIKLCQTSETSEHSNGPIQPSSDRAKAAVDSDSAGATAADTLKGNILADLPSQALDPGSTAEPCTHARALQSSAQEAAGILARTDMSQAAAIISSSLPGAVRDPGGHQGPGEGVHAVSKREMKRQGFVPVHGNYHRYYGYRIGQAFEEDPRLKVMEKPWFQNRKCLDLGCNEGVVTLGLVMRFGTASMLGVDIDPALIRKACRSLREEHTRATAELARLSHTRRHMLSAEPGADSEQTSQNAQRKAASAALQGLSGTHFQCANFLELGGLERGTYDTILCLSVAKWVHLNGGDAALHALLGHIYEFLAPGGRLILEPQPWSSYQAAVHKPGMRERLQPLSSLYLRPEDLPHYATQQFKFAFVRQLRTAENAKGFDRPIYLFQKLG